MVNFGPIFLQNVFFMDLIEPTKKGGRFFLGFTPSKVTFFSSWRCNVRIEEQMSRLRRREEIVMHSKEIISDHQVIMQCRN